MVSLSRSALFATEGVNALPRNAETRQSCRGEQSLEDLGLFNQRANPCSQGFALQHWWKFSRCPSGNPRQAFSKTPAPLQSLACRQLLGAFQTWGSFKASLSRGM